MEYILDVIPLGNGTTVKSQTRLLRNPTPAANFTKHRIASAGLRIFKTSKSENESGQLDIAYFRDGHTIDNNSTLSTDLGRPRNDRMRMYLAG